MLDKDQINKITNFARSHPEISAVYLFGSHAVGHARSRSDVDLGVLFTIDVDGFKRINIETQISNLLKKDVDLIDMRKSGPFLRHQIYKHGIVIFQDGSDYPFLFRANSIRDYLDTDYIRRINKETSHG
ncbi:MAG: nucleotidyltransferase domain-containing protein [Thermodesulfobacteriota bacterium]|nr:nucleotidyltransferase domain-containing protein [Thermodesulfobacteriota bacterium]